MSLELKIKYHDAKYGVVKRLEKLEKGDWIDVYCAQDIFIPSIFETLSAKKELAQEINSIMKTQIEIDEIFSHTSESMDSSFYKELQLKFQEKLNYFVNQQKEIQKSYLISLGFSLELPKNSEALLVPRSSTFKSFNLIQVNSPGVIDESYKGDNDIWHMPVIAIFDDVEIKKGDKVGQFRIQEKMPNYSFIEVDSLNNEDRGGFGSTGTK